MARKPQIRDPYKLRVRNVSTSLPSDVRDAVNNSHNQFGAKLRDEVLKEVQFMAQNAVDKAIEIALEHPETGIAREASMMPDVVAAPERVDDEQLFQLFAIYCGDVKRCALAANLDEATVEAKALVGGWRDKIKILIDLKTSSRPGDGERGINRAVNFVQAHRWRNHLQRVMNKLINMGDEELDEMICSVTVDKAGNVSKKLNTRAFADLSSAMEKCHAMSYSALNDTATERRERGDEPDENKTATAVHMNITRAMEEVRKQNRAEEAARLAAQSVTDTVQSPPS